MSPWEQVDPTLAADTPLRLGTFKSQIQTPGLGWLYGTERQGAGRGPGCPVAQSPLRAQGAVPTAGKRFSEKAVGFGDGGGNGSREAGNQKRCNRRLVARPKALGKGLINPPLPGGCRPRPSRSPRTHLSTAAPAPARRALPPGLLVPPTPEGREERCAVNLRPLS